MPRLFFLLLLVGLSTAPVRADSLPKVEVYKTPWCGCCTGWVDHMRSEGFPVAVRDLEDLEQVKRMAGIPGPLQSCHTAVVDGYLVEGHVPATDIKRLLKLRPNARGVAVPGMPLGSPGMEQGAEREPYDVLLFGGEQDGTVFSRHPGN